MRPESLRILHLTTSFPLGSENPFGLFVWRLIQALEKRGLSCPVLTPAGIRPSSMAQKLKVYRFRYAPKSWQLLANREGGIPETLNHNPLLYALVPQFLVSMAVHLVRMARRCDIIHAHWSICGAVAGLTQPFHGKPVVTTLRGADTTWAETRSPYAWLHEKSIKGSAVTVGVSSSIVKGLKERYPRLSSRFAFVPNGVDEDFYAIRPSIRSSLPPLRLLFVGSLILRKGLDSILGAIGSLDGPHKWTLTIAGDGAEKGRLVELAERYQISERIRFLGMVSPRKIPALMADHHLLVIPSRSEGRPNVVLEAMAAGLPVAGTDIDGIRELVRHGRTGWLVPPEDPGALAGVLKSIIQGEIDHKTAGKAARAWMIEHGLTWDKTAKQYCELYKKCLNKERPHVRNLWTH
ncbi:MAG: glycosyltransferase family 4 protein [Deltaproteobacteria bacterium]|nr:glycosyltransferase family 4 protein [Deltaproteobacteria bacterium]